MQLGYFACFAVHQFLSIPSLDSHGLLNLLTLVNAVYALALFHGLKFLGLFCLFWSCGVAELRSSEVLGSTRQTAAGYHWLPLRLDLLFMRSLALLTMTAASFV